MTIQRSKRPLRPAGRGRPRRLSTPPSSIGGPNVILNLFSVTDLPELANAAGLSFAAGCDVLVAVGAINEAFSNYANATAMQVGDSPAGERRDWSAGLARAAADLHRSLGHTKHSLFMEQPAFDAAESLSKGWPTDPQTPEDHTLREDLTSALSFALPDKYALQGGCKCPIVDVPHPQGAAGSAHSRPPQAVPAGCPQTSRGSPDFDGGIWDLIGRLGPMLHALSLTAEATAKAWGAETIRGKGGKERGRRYLMEMLVPAFTHLFEQPPTASPGSNGFRWFSALITQAGRLAGDQRHLPYQGEPEELQVHEAALQAVEAVARHIAPPPYETATKGAAKLDHWIREALAASGTRQARPVPSAASRTREPKIGNRE